MEGVQKLQSLVEESSQERDQLQSQLDEETIRSANVHQCRQFFEGGGQNGNCLYCVRKTSISLMHRWHSVRYEQHNMFCVAKISLKIFHNLEDLCYNVIAYLLFAGISRWRRACPRSWSSSSES